MNDFTPRPCDLCGLPVQIPDFSLRTKQGLKYFCCEGCEGVYRMLHEPDVVTTDNESPGNRK
jgi:hypothetical protein